MKIITVIIILIIFTLVLIYLAIEDKCPKCGGKKWYETYTGKRCKKCDYHMDSRLERILKFFGLK